MKKVSIFLSALLMMVCFSVTITANAGESKVNLAECEDVTIALSESSFTYDGSKKTPEVTVTFYDTELQNGVDYKLSYSNNTKAGTAKVTVTGIGSYKGKLTKEFTIKKADISKDGKIDVVIDKTSYVYYGKEIKPAVTVYYNNAKMTEGTSYKLSYSGNKSIGKAKITVKGIGNYKGTVKKYFYIKPKQIKNLKLKNITTSSVVLKWSRITGVSGYKIYSYQPAKKTYTLVGTVNSAKTGEFKITNLEPNIQYQFVVCAFKNVGDKKYYGEYSDKIKAAVRPKKVTLLACAIDGSKLAVDYSAVKCAGYQIFYSTDKDMKKDVKTVKVASNKTSYSIGGIDKTKTHYVRVRAYTTLGTKILNGEKSSKMSTNYSNVYASYSSYYENNANRTNNLRIASNAINGTIILPGETFDFNKIVGPRTAAKGYKPAHVFTNGTEISNEIGGGICQVASTIFNCALKANVQIVERHQHAQRVAYVPLGRDAAIYGNANNFRWKNTTDYPIKVKMSVKDGVISCTFATCQKAKPKNVELKVYQNGNNFTLNRIVDGKVNYSCKSNY